MRFDVHAHARDAGWGNVLRACGVDEAVLHERHQPCLSCGGEDRFRFISLAEGRWICNQCRPDTGSGFDLLMLLNGWSFRDAANKVRGAVGVVTPLTDSQRLREAEKRKAEWAARKDRIVRVWRSGIPVVGSVNPAWEYLEGRGVAQGVMDDLRFTHTVGDGVLSPSPCMVAAVRDARGFIVSLHRTFLEDFGWAGWQKADVRSPKQPLPPLGTISGAAVRLQPFSGGVLGVAEGIENALAASLFVGGAFPVWACLSAGGLKSFVVPEGVSELVVFADRDANGVGQAAAYSLALEHAAVAEVRLPPVGAGDWCDYVGS